MWGYGWLAAVQGNCCCCRTAQRSAPTQHTTEWSPHHSQPASHQCVAAWRCLSTTHSYCASSSLITHGLPLLLLLLPLMPLLLLLLPHVTTRHSLHAIAAQLSPAPGCSGIQLLQADSFDLHCLQVCLW